jgi:hypothetical protein
MSTKKWSIAFLLVSITLLSTQSFVIKKTREIVLSPKDQSIAALADYMTWSPAISKDIGLFLQAHGSVQESITRILKVSLEDDNKVFESRSEKEIKQIRDTMHTVHGLMSALDGQLMVLYKELEKYDALLKDNQKSKVIKKND